ncbi:hypothetical protein HK102_013451, partial [Quaeritorhiza haematococci]
PESAGADPGPTCYRKGGPLTITDANLLLGRLLPTYFPKIFGPTEREPLDVDATQHKFEELAAQINGFMKEQAGKEGNGARFRAMTVDEIAAGFVKVANESMCRPIRALTQAKGYDTAGHVLACFGGAGGQHACAIARSLGIRRILIHRFSSILSAYGLSLADVVHEVQEPSATTLNPENIPHIRTRALSLQKDSITHLKSQGFPPHLIETEIYLNLRYNGTDTALMTLKPKAQATEDNDSCWGAFEEEFVKMYKQEFGFHLPDREIVVDDIRIRGIGKSFGVVKTKVYDEIEELSSKSKSTTMKPKPDSFASVYFADLPKSTAATTTGGRVQTPVHRLEHLPTGTKIEGPALIIDATATIVVHPDCEAVVTSEHVVVTVGGGKGGKRVGTEMDPIQLSVFGHRFMSIAEQMGRTLQKTSISTNIKERLDFSCALFGPDAGLVANAPHIPVHLGSMQEAVKWQMEHLGANIKDGDVLLTNHPSAGGSHLPDVSVWRVLELESGSD